MWPILNMVWRIGDILPVPEQIEWCRAAGFDGVGFHASAGSPGAWTGVEPSTCDASSRQDLRARLAGFARCEVHAPFAIVLADGALEASCRSLEPILAFAGDVGARVVTVHAELPPIEIATAERWTAAMRAIDATAAAYGLTVGLEVVSGFSTIQGWGLAHVGVTLDVGHMYIVENGRHLAPFGSLGSLVRRLGASLVHLHMHDVAAADHLELGTGRVDFGGLIAALRETGYAKGMCLEMNPDRVLAEGIRRSLAWLRQHAAGEVRP